MLAVKVRSTVFGYRYYGSVECEAWNDAEGAEGTCLVICNSMGRPLKESIASNYRHVKYRLHPGKR